MPDSPTAPTTGAVARSHGTILRRIGAIELRPRGDQPAPPLDISQRSAPPAPRELACAVLRVASNGSRGRSPLPGYSRLIEADEEDTLRRGFASRSCRQRGSNAISG